MTDNAKFFVRPKVRFCQNDTCEPDAGELKRSINQNVRQSNKPKIRSIVTLDKPVKLLKFNKPCDVHDDNDAKMIDNTHKNKSSIVCTKTPPVCTTDKNHAKVKNQKPLDDNKNIKNIKANFKDTDLKISAKLSQNKKVPAPLNKVLKKTNVSQSNIKGKKGKENETLDAKSNKNITKVSPELKVTNQKITPSTVGTDVRKANVACKTSVTSKKNICTKPGVMPCHKYTKIASKIKTCPVKKTMIRDVIGPKIKPCITSGVSHKRQNDLKSLETDEGTSVKPSMSGEKFARPEYNSVTCTINKLNELRKQKVVTDFEHLPSSYKHFINGKISSALDFPLDEAIYKNLVDLSVDENQLPGRLIRSKDPEPRHKDAVPILSDFFMPASTEEYYTPVSIKPRIPETTETWNAFAISDKIFEWKRMLEDV